ncbi:MAG: hypothetical protein ABL903_20235 [Methylococcales bacterium]
MNLSKVFVKICLLSILVLSPCLLWATILTPVPDDQRCKNWGDVPMDGPRAYDDFIAQVTMNFRRNDKTLALLERDTNEWNTPSCVFEGGEQVLISLTKGLDTFFTKRVDWTDGLARVQLVKAKFPDTPFVALAEAIYWKHFAWHARGSGMASSVTPEGWKLFRERLEMAEKVLIDSKPYASELPNWYAEMITVQSALDRPGIDKVNTFLEGTKKHKTYLPIYTTMLKFQLPKWGGNWEGVDNMVKWSVENTQATEGNAMYSRLYWAVFVHLLNEEKLFRDTRASWPKMKLGFEDMMTNYPKSKWNLNNFAMFACLAEDKETFLTLRNKIGADIMLEAWQKDISLELCEIKYGYAQ